MNAFVRTAIYLLSLGLLPLAGAVVWFQHDVIELASISPWAVLIPLLLFAPAAYAISFVAPESLLGQIWPYCQYLVARVLYCCGRLLSHVEHYRRALVHIALIGLVIGCLGTKNTVTYLSTVGVSRELLADFAYFTNTAVISPAHHFEAERLHGRFLAASAVLERYPELSLADDAIRDVFLPPERPLPERLDRAVDRLAEVSDPIQTLDGHVVRLLRTRLLLTRARQRDTKEAELADVCRAWSTLQSISVEALGNYATDSPSLQRALASLKSSYFNSMAAVRLACAKNYNYLTQQHLNIVPAEDQDLEYYIREAGDYLRKASALSSLTPIERLRAVNNELDFLLWRLRESALDPRTDHRGPTTSAVRRVDTVLGKEFAGGEQLLREKLASLKRLLPISPRPNMLMTIAQVHLLLAHSAAHTNNVDSLRTDLDEVGQYVSFAIKMGFDVNIMSDVESVDELGFRWLVRYTDDPSFPNDDQRDELIRNTATYVISLIPVTKR